MTDTETQLDNELSADEEFVLVTAEQEGTEGKEAEPPKEEAPATVKIGDKEYKLEDLATLVPAGERAQELEKGARTKFDEAAALRKEAEAKEQEIADIKLIVNVLQNGTQEQKAVVLKELGQVFQAEDINEGELTENEAALKKVFDAKIRQLEVQNQQLAKTLETLAPALEDIKAWTGTKREAEQMQADIATIKEKTGMDVTAEQIQGWKNSGITDPVKAMPVIFGMLQAAQKPTEKAPDEIPDKTQVNSFDPDDPSIDVDEMFDRVVRQQQQPSR